MRTSTADSHETINTYIMYLCGNKDILTSTRTDISHKSLSGTSVCASSSNSHLPAWASPSLNGFASLKISLPLLVPEALGDLAEVTKTILQ